MCGGVFYLYQNKSIINYFHETIAQLPALTKADNAVLLLWGKRIKEAGQLP